ncbi:MAG: DUF6519 domain-containing protein [Phycisphaerae bacterium]|nr:DUF6519 domain-containing protein [Phycisphaerae bacterium]MDZ4832026.1 DUF6519 domain-containing protein [Phycisphaerae bacterium]
MTTDISRNSFDPALDFTGVLMQQGKVLLDSEANEKQLIDERRSRATSLDTLGRSAVPRTTPDGFRITLAGAVMSIGQGRMYVDGVLAECHGAGSTTFDGALGELQGNAAVPYLAQPFFDAPPALPTGSAYLVYIDVWQRDVTFLERSELVEPALGVDTSSRTQTVWQVRALPNIGDSVSAATPDAQVPGWNEIIRPSDGRLTTSAAPVPPDEGPCTLPPIGGYRGLDHRLYRVEIHTGGAPGTATFKWARHNASVGAAVVEIRGGARLRVERFERDAERGFSSGNWVEITDDARERNRQPGVFCKIREVLEATNEIVLETAVPSGTFTVDAQNRVDATKHVRVRRWDQRGSVRDTAGVVLQDLDAAGSAGVITVPALGTTKLQLEDGIEIALSVAASGGRLRRGDHWTFAVRTAAGASIEPSIEPLTLAPPRGVHHHYARLAIVSAAGQVADCRRMWPPEASEGGCGCTVCVEAAEHESGVSTIQMAIDQVIAAGGGTVCVGPGRFSLGDGGARIARARSLTVRGHGNATTLVGGAKSAALVIEGQSVGVLVEDLRITTLDEGDLRPPLVALRDSADVRLRRLFLQQNDRGAKTASVIALEGALVGVTISDCALAGIVGVTNATTNDEFQALIAVDLRLERNLFICSRAGVRLAGTCIHAGPTVFSDNMVFGGGEAGIILAGIAPPGAGADIRGNQLFVSGLGLLCGLDGARIVDNRLGGVTKLAGGAIVLRTTRAGDTLERCVVEGNQIVGVGGHGILIEGAVGSVTVRNNVLDDIGGNGIAMDGDAEADLITIESNQLSQIGVGKLEIPVAAVTVTRAGRAIVRGNVVSSVGRGPSGERIAERRVVGIQLIACGSASVSDNRVTGIGPDEGYKSEAAAVAVLAGGSVDINGNGLSRDADGQPKADDAPWTGVAVVGSAPDLGEFIVGDVHLIAGSDLAAKRSLAYYMSPKSFFEIKFTGSAPVTVSANRIDARGGRPAIDINRVGALTLSANQVRLRGSDIPVKASAGLALVVNGNAVSGGNDQVSLDLRAPKSEFAAIAANATSGEIRLNGQSNLGPFTAMNVRAPS